MPAVSVIGLVLALFVLSVGTSWAFFRGAADFGVYHSAWSLALAGRGMEIYSATPDRFLYAPGFAWLLAPLGALPAPFALAFWTGCKVFATGAVLHALSLRLKVSFGIAVWGIVLAARPILIDLQYGQINLFVMAAAVWPLLRHRSEEKARAADFLAWFALGLVAFAKLIAVPLCLVPWIAPSGVPGERLRLERLGVLAGIGLLAFLPLPFAGFDGARVLYSGWWDALVARGLPLESHNQSFSAFLHHYFSGNPTHVLGSGPLAMQLGGALLSMRSIELLGLGWSFATLGLLVGWLLPGKGRTPSHWAAIAVAALILPSHLIWKPYFVLSVPVAAVALADGLRELADEVRTRRIAGLFLAFLAMNLTGFDFVGQRLAGRFESASVLFLSHLGFILLAVIRPPPRMEARA